MLKILFLPLNYGSVFQTGWEDAFREANCQLESFDFFTYYESHRQDRDLTNRQFLQKLDSFLPDLIFLQIQHTDIIFPKTIATIKQKYPYIIICNWTGDVRNYIPPVFEAIGKLSDYNLISSIGQIDMFEKILNKKVHFLQIGYDPKLYYPLPNPRSSFDYDCSFIATNNAKEGYPGVSEREQTCRILRKDFGSRFALYGNHWAPELKSKGTIDQKKVVTEVYHKSIACISVSHYNDLSHYFSDRLLMCMASGRPTVSLYFPNWESYFADRCDLLIAKNPEDIAIKVRQVKNEPDYADFIGSMGSSKVAAEHTYFSRVVELLSIVGASKS